MAGVQHNALNNQCNLLPEFWQWFDWPKFFSFFRRSADGGEFDSDFGLTRFVWGPLTLATTKISKSNMLK